VDCRLSAKTRDNDQLMISFQRGYGNELLGIGGLVQLVGASVGTLWTLGRICFPIAHYFLRWYVSHFP
jgi:hypothetical protein